VETGLLSRPMVRPYLSKATGVPIASAPSFHISDALIRARCDQQVRALCTPLF